VTRNLLIGSALLTLLACSSTSVTRVLDYSASGDAPYDNVLVISLFKSFDARRYLERAIVKELEAQGVTAVASTSLMEFKTPATRDTFVAMVKNLDADAVLVTQLVSAESKAEMKTTRPESTYNIRDTFYYNVWNVELTEYTEPQGLELTHSVSLAVQLYSAARLEPVWAIETKTEIVTTSDRRRDPSVIGEEAQTIVRYLSRDGLLAP